MELRTLVRDQAKQLRLVAQQGVPQDIPQRSAPRVIAITSGKGGVGKTSMSTNLAILLAQQGHRVLVFDADLGLANVDVLLGLHPRYTLQHVLYGECGLTDVLMTGPCDVKIIPGASGMVELANLDDAQRNELVLQFGRLGDEADIILLDTSPGVSRNVIGFAAAADEAVVVTTPEPTSVTDAYAIIKVIARENIGSRIRLLVNMARDEHQATEAVQKVVLVARQFINTSVETVGWVPSDPSVSWAAHQQEPFVLAYPRSLATQSLRIIAERIGRDTEPTIEGDAQANGGMKAFLEKMGAAFKRK
jgi:flagellar biosynthesis protein FlhG